MSLFKKTIQILIIMISIFSVSSFSFAQTSTTDSLSSIRISVTPSNLRAGDSVVLTVNSDSLYLPSSKITWYLDGVARKETSNQSITIKAKDNGSNTSVRVVVETPDGIIKEASVEIVPGGVDLVVEPISYTLPFYKGKPYLISQGSARVVALADVTVNSIKMSVNDLTFKWFVGDNYLVANSGKGKNSMIVNSVIPVKDIIVHVQVLDDLGNTLAETSKILMINNPKILFFENNPLYGVLYNQSISGNYYLGTNEELDVIAKPFSFSFMSDTSLEAIYVWYINGGYISPSGKDNELVLKQESTNLSGTATISLGLKNSKKINQLLSGTFDVSFGQ